MKDFFKIFSTVGRNFGGSWQRQTRHSDDDHSGEELGLCRRIEYLFACDGKDQRLSGYLHSRRNAVACDNGHSTGGSEWLVSIRSLILCSNISYNTEVGNVERQQKIYLCIADLLNFRNYPSFSSRSNFWLRKTDRFHSLAKENKDFVGFQRCKRHHYHFSNSLFRIRLLKQKGDHDRMALHGRGWACQSFNKNRANNSRASGTPWNDGLQVSHTLQRKAQRHLETGCRGDHLQGKSLNHQIPQ